jgi:hypothetical protein
MSIPTVSIVIDAPGLLPGHPTKEPTMSDFILLLHQRGGLPPQRSREEVTAIIEEYQGWADRMRREGRHKGGEKLTNDAGRVMRLGAGGITVTDGPYAESKELIGGFFVIAAEDYDEALRVAESCPHLKYGAGIEIRQIDIV